MRHFSCDACGKAMDSDADRFTVHIEVYPSQDTESLSQADLDCDHLEAMSEMLSEQEDPNADPADALPSYRKLRYELCPSCQARFVRDPLGLESSQKFHFSKN